MDMCPVPDNETTSTRLREFLTKLRDDLDTDQSWLTPEEFSVWVTTTTALALPDVGKVTTLFTLRLLLALDSIERSLTERSSTIGEKHARAALRGAMERYDYD